jgi:hypothetical protein
MLLIALVATGLIASELLVEQVGDIDTTLIMHSLRH